MVQYAVLGIASSYEVVHPICKCSEDFEVNFLHGAANAKVVEIGSAKIITLKRLHAEAG